MTRPVTGTRTPIFVPSTAESLPIQSGQDYFFIRIHGAQAAFRGSMWERVKALIVASHVDLNHPAFAEGGVRALQRSREVKRDRGEQLGLSTNLVNLVPAVMTHVSISIDFILDKENRLSALSGLINSDAFLATVSLAPATATIAKTVSGIASKIIDTFVPAEEREPILQFAGDFNLAGNHVQEGYYAIVGTRDESVGLPDASAKYDVINGSLHVDGRPADWLSYIILDVRRVEVRGTELSGGAPWARLLRQAEDDAENALRDPFATADQRQDVWKQCVSLLKEAQVLLRNDPNYHRHEADRIVRASLAACQRLVEPQPAAMRGVVRGIGGPVRGVADDLVPHLAALGVQPEDLMHLTQAAEKYAVDVSRARAVLSDLGGSIAV